MEKKQFWNKNNSFENGPFGDKKLSFWNEMLFWNENDRFGMKAIVLEGK